MRTPRSLTACMILAACLFTDHQAVIDGFVVFASPFLVQNSPSWLVPEVPFEGSLKNGTKQELRFRVEANDYFTLEIGRPAIGISWVLSTPDGRVRRKRGCAEGQTSRIAEVTQLRTDYVVELSTCAGEQSDLSYQFRLSTPHVAKQSERIEVQAERSEERADALVREYRADSNRTALAAYEDVLQTWQLRHDSNGELRTLLKLAKLASDVAQTDKAITFADRALTASRAQKNAEAEAHALLILAALRLRGGDPVSAQDYSKRALEVTRSTSNLEFEAQALLAIGDAGYDKGDLDGAGEAYTQAYSISNETGNQIGRAMSLLGLSTVFGDRSELDDAKKKADEAYSIFTLMSDKWGQARSATILGHIQTRLGRKQEALDFYEQARDILKDSGDLLAEAILYAGIARTHGDLGDDSTALQYFKLALDRYRHLGHRLGEGTALRAVGEFYFRVGDTARALRNLEDAIDAFQRLPNKKYEAYCWWDIGVVYDSTGDAGKAVDYFRHVLDLNGSFRDGRLESRTLAGLAHVYEGKRDFGVALEYYEQAIQVARTTNDRFGELAALYGSISSLRRLDRLDEALQRSQTAVSSIESLRSSVAGAALRTSYFSSVMQHYDLQIDLLMRLTAKGAPAFAARALEVSERSRARSLLDSISETRNTILEGVDPSLLEREVSLGRMLDAKSERYTQLISRNPNSAEATSLDSEIRRLNAEYDQLLGQLRVRSPHYAELVQPQPLNLKQIQEQVLEDDSLQLQFALGEDQSYLWAITHNDFSSHVLPKRSDIEAKVRRVRALMTSPPIKPGEKPAEAIARRKREEAEYPLAVAELSEMLLGPVADRLGTKRLVIVADGVLQYLPFGALPTPRPAQGESAKPLIAQHEVVNLPSASTLAVIRKEAPRRGNPDRTIAVFADPVFQATDRRVTPTQAVTSAARPSPNRTAQGTKQIATLAQVNRGSDVIGAGVSFPRLTATAQEAKAILSMVPEDRRYAAIGFDATKTAAMSGDLNRYKIVHFATHTNLNEGHPELSSLVLSLVDKTGKPQNGHLRLRDIYNMRLSAELVVLSACDTALGKEVKGEGLMSMVRGFMYSGTPRVLASLWQVDDEATAEFMQEFYTQLFQNKLTPAAALQQAQIKQMQKPARKSPFYWAGFQLQGEWKP
jgi:CHAT domain-containing protein/tetratricopeptide (TPR) repeat protein